MTECPLETADQGGNKNQTTGPSENQDICYGRSRSLDKHNYCESINISRPARAVSSDAAVTRISISVASTQFRTKHCHSFANLYYYVYVPVIIPYGVLRVG